MSNSSKVMVALLAGVVAGTALGVMVAPGEGRESRESLWHSADDLRLSLCGRANDKLWKLSKWRRRMLSLAKALIIGPGPEMPDDLEHG